MSVAVVYDKRCEDHSANYRHVERPERIQCIWAALEAGGYFKEGRGFTHLPCRQATDEELLRVHSQHLISCVDASAEAQYNPSEEDSDEEPTCGIQAKYPDCKYLDSTRDTFVSKGSALAARCAAGGLTELAMKVAQGGSVRNGIAVVRPPGHHAEHNEAMGFCLYNSVAVATRALQAVDPSQRVVIVDWDVHHGNGTQNLLCDGKSDILYLSMHRYGDGFFPGTGAVTDCGCVGKCNLSTRSTAINVPLTKRGAGDIEYHHIVERVFVPAIIEFGATTLIVSAGFDCAAGDPLGGMAVSPMGFGAMLYTLCCALEASHIKLGLGPGKRGVVVALEGGYSLEMLAASSLVCADVLHGSLIPEPDVAECSQDVVEVVDQVCSFHTQHGWQSFHN